MTACCLVRVYFARRRGWHQKCVSELTNSSFIQMQYDLFNGQRDASSAPLTMTDNSIAPSSDDVAVPVDPLGSSRWLLFQNRGERKGFTFSGNCPESLKHLILALG